MNRSAERHGFSGYILILFLAIGIVVLLQEKNPGVRTIGADEVAQLLRTDSTVVLLDVRDKDEWNSSAGHIRNAIWIPLQDLPSRFSQLKPYRDRRIIVYCRSGSRSGRATRILSDSGFNAANMTGGIRAWSARQLPVLQEKAP